VDFAEAYEDVAVEGASIVQRTGLRVVYQFQPGTVAASELIGRVLARYPIRDLAVREPDIEDTVRRIYEEQLLRP
jgi:ABC-2 type transport system ATP-binding protein